MKCKLCGTTLIKRQGKYGEFLACPNSKIGEKHTTKSLTPNTDYEEEKQKDRDYELDGYR